MVDGPVDGSQETGEGEAPTDIQTVAVDRSAMHYPAAFPFDPDERYPEYRGAKTSGTPNLVYRAVRQNFIRLGYDQSNAGGSRWNPLAWLVKPGDRVLVKPNLVTHEYRKSCGQEGDLFSVITHPSVLRAVCDYVALALRGEGEIVIADNPSIDADFEQLLGRTRLDLFPALYRDTMDTRCRVLDLRPRVTRDLTYYGYQSKTTAQQGDPEGSTRINLGAKSYFHGVNPLLFRGIYTNRRETVLHHRGNRHEYELSNTILNANVFISVPKLKCHHKVGVTLNIKGLVGINAEKNLLVHWRIGYPGMGGDEYPPPHRMGDNVRLAVQHLLADFTPEPLYLVARRALSKTPLAGLLDRKVVSSHEKYRGAWEGNDTCWRMAADLYNLFVHDLAGWRGSRGIETRFFSVVDGVVAGEKDGPFCPTAKAAGAVISGSDLLAVDCVATRLMDLRIEAVRYLANLLQQHNRRLGQLMVRDDGADGDFFAPSSRHLGFQAPTGWPSLAAGADQRGEA